MPDLLEPPVTETIVPEPGPPVEPSGDFSDPTDAYATGGDFLAEKLREFKPAPETPVEPEKAPEGEKTPEKVEKPAVRQLEAKTTPAAKPSDKPEEKKADEVKPDDKFAAAPKTVKEANAFFADYRRVKKQLEEMAPKLAALEKNGVPAAPDPKVAGELESTKKELETLKKQNTDYEREVFAARLEQSPAWKEAVQDPTLDVLKTIAEIAGANDLTEDELQLAVGEANPVKRRARMNAVMAKLPLSDAQDLKAQEQKWLDISKKRDALQADSKAAMEQINGEAASKTTAQQAKEQRELQQAVASAGQQFETKWTMFSPENRTTMLPADLQEYAKQADQRIAAFDWQKTPAADRGAIIQAAFKYPVIADMAHRIMVANEKEAGEKLAAAEAKIKELETRIGNRNAAEPGISAGGEELPDDSDRDIGQIVAQGIGRR